MFLLNIGRLDALLTYGSRPSEYSYGFGLLHSVPARTASGRLKLTETLGGLNEWHVRNRRNPPNRINSFRSGKVPNHSLEQAPSAKVGGAFVLRHVRVDYTITQSCIGPSLS